jgi:hypothetical protein
LRFIVLVGCDIASPSQLHGHTVMHGIPTVRY